MDCRQIAEHLAGGREGLIGRAGREEFASEKKAGLAREQRRRVFRLGTTISGGDGNDGDGYGDGGDGSVNRRAGNRGWRGGSRNDRRLVSCG